jgi:hypothetical protein
MLTFEPLLPLSFWLALVGVAAIVLTWYGWRRPPLVPKYPWRGLVALMTVGVTIVLLLLLNPMIVEPVPQPPGPPILTVLVDATASMATPDSDSGRTRHQAAAHWAQAIAKTKSEFEMRVATFDQSVKFLDPNDLDARTPDGTLTDLRTALREATAEQRPQGQMVVLLSDGIHNAGESAAVLQAARDAKALACPIFTRTFGSDRESRDLAVEVRTPQEIAFVGHKIGVAAWLLHRDLAGQSAKVRLMRDGKAVEERTVPLKRAEGEELRFELHEEKTGLYRYEVVADPLPGEMSLTNNAAAIQLQVVDQPVRVLLLEGKPYWDSKFLARTLTEDASIELESVVRMTEGRLYRRTLRRPSDAAKKTDESWEVLPDFGKFLASGKGLRAFQVIVLGRDAEVFLDGQALSELRTWLTQDGGSLVCSRGQPVTQVSQGLAPLLPVRWTPTAETRLEWSLTDRGRDLGWLLGRETLAALPTLAVTARPEQPRPLAVVLATAKAGDTASAPAVTYQPYGLGRVVTIEGSGMWRWAFLPPAQRDREQAFGTLWHNLLRWLVSNATLLPGQSMALRTGATTFSPHEAISVTLLTRRETAPTTPPSLELRGASLESPRTIAAVPRGDEPGVYRVPVGKLSEGTYDLHVVGEPSVQTIFDVRSLSRETLDLKPRPDLMAAIARESGGAVLDQPSPEATPGRMAEHLRQMRPMQVRRLSAWDRGWVLAAAVGLWATTWVLRRRRHLL